jgi:exodeoxyribonuclease-3
MKIVTWNVNGLRAIHKKGFADFLKTENPDVLCLQETKAHPKQIEEELRVPEGYFAEYHSCSIKKGYSGVVTFTKIQPERSTCGFGIEQFDQEGRVVQSDFGEFILFNIYFPNGAQSDDRDRFKMSFYDTLGEHLRSLKNSGRKIIVCGDFNIAHTELDIARPRENVMTSGFRPYEREKFSEFLKLGFTDSFREFTPDGGNYTWWSHRMGARERNIGWRIDYHCVSNDLMPRVKDVHQRPDVVGSDHCPVVLELDF